MESDGFPDDLVSIITHRSFPCIGAQKALKDGTIGHYVCRTKLTNSDSAKLVGDALYAWMDNMGYKLQAKWPAMQLATFVAIFENDNYANEDALEKDVWHFLSGLHKYDRSEYEWDTLFQPFVYGKDFAMSVGGFGHFVPVLSPIASSPVRRSSRLTLVFNPHFVFQKLRDQGLFENWKALIRARETTAQGWISPKLGDSGISYEAPQYALTINPIFDIGACPFTGKPRPSDFPVYRF